METSLHQQLKALYAGGSDSVEVVVGEFRIDAIADGELIEIQHASLASLRDKTRRLLARHRVRIVKPIVANKLLVNQDARGGQVVSRRRSPKRGTLLDLFDELVYFRGLFPHRRLTIEALLVDVEEWRYPGHGRRRRWRERDHEVEDQRLVAAHESISFRTAADLRQLLPVDLPRPFHTGQLATQLDVSRTIAQRIAYCLRHAGTVRQVGKAGNALLYEFKRRARAGAA